MAVQAGAVTLFEAPVVAAALGSPEMRSLRALVAGGEADVSRLAAAFETLTTSASNRYDPLAAPVGLFLGANTLFTESQVDYRAPLYLNVTRPVLGSAAADARLAPDGTLTQAGAEIKDTTAEALLAAVPVKELVTALIPGDRSARLLAAQGGVPVMLQLVTEPQFVKHVYWIVSQGACPGGAPPISAGLPGSMYRRELQQTKP